MLVNCAAYQSGRKLGDIAIGEVPRKLQLPDCFVWVAWVDPDPEEFEATRREFRLHELAVEDALCGHPRPKIVEYGDSLFAVLQLIDINGGKLEVGEVDIFVGARYVVSVRSGSRQTFVNVRQRCEEEPHLLKQGTAFVLYAIMETVVERYFPVLDALETELESIEEAIFAGGSQRSAIERLYELKQKVTTMRHAVVPLREDVGKLFGGRVPNVCLGMQEYFRDVYDHLQRIQATIDDLRESIATAIQVNLALMASDANDVNKRLAAWAGIFAVATAFVGVWGMNFDNMPELKWSFGYPVALALITTACGFMFWRFKRAGWL